MMDALLIRMRLDCLVSARFGPHGTSRPQVPVHKWAWRNTLEARPLEGFVWNIYDDTHFPRAIGLRMIADAREGPVYEAAEWHGPQDIRFSHWRLRGQSGWTQLLYTEGRKP